MLDAAFSALDWNTAIIALILASIVTVGLVTILLWHSVELRGHVVLQMKRNLWGDILAEVGGILLSAFISSVISVWIFRSIARLIGL